MSIYHQIKAAKYNRAAAS
ncbi:hypothetical protein CGLO_13905 [Colletotrichum gloeosporioides Cg-14]|uniref:Uncharacterized protein n=1 Tax=Colletotrichum gloeosporioides (strain Cg-14) TaxID=1237896 RepID=T0K523_COLGC|nr:hypothetical protein CGLO_13905 [Colletotrichum gloeosporioides Cg-14]